jgi:hypothetical protein
MKPKKRQPLDFSAVPVETPAEEAVATSEVPIFEDEADAEPLASVDAPATESDLDLEIALPEPEPSSPRARAASRRARISEPTQPAFEPSPAVATSLATSAPQPPAPILEPERDATPARTEEGSSPDVRRSADAFELPEKADRQPMSGLLFWTLAVAVASLWALAPIAFAMGYARDIPALKVEGFALAVFVGLALGPALMTLLGAYLLRQAQGVSAELKRNRTMTDRLVTPALLAAVGATGAVEAVRDQIDNATIAANEARERILSLRQALAEETAKLAEAAADSSRMANQLAQGLGHERQALETLSLTLDTRSTAVVDAIGSQARMVAEASDLAETQLREAEAALAARAADLAAAAAEASDAARVGAEDISRQIARLETAGQGSGRPDEFGREEPWPAARRPGRRQSEPAVRAGGLRRRDRDAHRPTHRIRLLHAGRRHRTQRRGRHGRRGPARPDLRRFGTVQGRSRDRQARTRALDGRDQQGPDRHLRRRRGPARRPGG